MIYLTDRPTLAKWLRPDQQRWLTARLEAERAQREAIRHYALAETLLEPRVWLLTLVYFGQNVSGYGFVLFLPQIVSRFGASISQVGLLVGAVVFLALGHDRRLERAPGVQEHLRDA